jgi:hypothetical protein
MPEATAQLDYAPAPPVLRRRWARRSMLGMVLLTAVAAGAWWGPGAYRRASVLYWQRQCMRYTAPGEWVAYESDPVAGAALRSADPHYQFAPLAGRPRKPMATGYLPECWTRFVQANPGFPTASGPILFLHELRTPSGRSRLVAVAGAFDPLTLPQFINGYDVGGEVIEPATWTTPSQNRTGGMFISVLTDLRPEPPHLRVYAGQPDPADPSHFTIRYEVEGVTHVVDGWLRDDPWPAGYSSVKFKVRG